MKVFTVKRTRLITETFRVIADDEEEVVSILSDCDTVADNEDCALDGMETLNSEIDFINVEEFN